MFIIVVLVMVAFYLTAVRQKHKLAWCLLLSVNEKYKTDLWYQTASCPG